MFRAHFNLFNFNNQPQQAASSRYLTLATITCLTQLSLAGATNSESKNGDEFNCIFILILISIIVRFLNKNDNQEVERHFWHL